MTPEEYALREPFGGKFYGIWNVEGDGEPVVFFMRREDAERELVRRRALPEDDDDRMGDYHHVFPADIAGCFWNSFEPEPRGDDTLTLDEIVYCQKGGDV